MPFVTLEITRSPNGGHIGRIDGLPGLDPGEHDYEEVCARHLRDAFAYRFRVTILPFQPKKLCPGTWSIAFMTPESLRRALPLSSPVTRPSP